VFSVSSVAYPSFRTFVFQKSSLSTEDVPMSSRFAVELLEGRVLLASVPQNFVETVVATGLNTPTAMQFAPDGRLFVAQQSGQLRVITASGQLLSTPALSVIVNSTGERGLLGLTFDPNFSSNNYIYVYYTATTPNLHNRLSRFTMNGDVAVAASETVLLDLDSLNATNHNGGALRFGNDGKLYVAVGENAVASNSQTLSNLHGKMLRLNADGSIPTDNPFYNTATGKNRAIWSLGLRNPFTFDVERDTGRMFINDVGQSNWEEINLGVRGVNYGWPNTEGYTSDPAFRSPVFAYPRTIGGVFNGAAITGAAFYDPLTSTFPTEMAGDYFFADYVGNWIRRIDTTGSSPVLTEFATGLAAPVDLQVHDNGSLYYLERGNSGRVVRVDYSPSELPVITGQPVNQVVTAGQPVTFTVTASGPAALGYQWTRNGNDINGATGSTYTINSTTTGDSGAVFRVVVTSGGNSTTSNAATLTVTNNTAPSATIISPAHGTQYNAGQTFTFTGTGSDQQDGALPASAFTWRVDLHHDTHVHPFVPTTTGVTSGTFTIPAVGHTETNVFYRITLTVVDSGGLSTTVVRDVTPRVVNLTVGSNFVGLSLTLDGQPSTAPFSTQSVVGVVRTLGAPTTQMLSGVTYQFTGWSDGGVATHDITTPATAATYTANYVATTAPIGTGLRATYYDNINFTGKLLNRVDADVNFDWKTAAPASGFGVDKFAVRWTGKVTPQFSQTYTFYTQSDDRVRLWVDGKLVVNNWTDHSVTENSGTIALNAGQVSTIRLDYAENVGNALIKLLWASSSQAKQIVPASRLTPSPAVASFSTANINGASSNGTTTTLTTGINYDLTAGGVGGITSTADSFRFVYRSIAGDFDISTRIAEFTKSNSHAKAGLMARSSLSSGSAYVGALITPTQNASQYRSTTNGGTTQTVTGSLSFAEVWVRLRRVGDTFSTFSSADGVTWSLTRTITINAPDTMYVGMAASSKSNALTTVRFRDATF